MLSRHASSKSCVSSDLILFLRTHSALLCWETKAEDQFGSRQSLRAKKGKIRKTKGSTKTTLGCNKMLSSLNYLTGGEGFWSREFFIGPPVQKEGKQLLFPCQKYVFRRGWWMLQKQINWPGGSVPLGQQCRCQ